MPRGFKKAVAPSEALEAAKTVVLPIDAGNVVHAGGLNPNAMTPSTPKQGSIFDQVAEQNLIAAKSNPLKVDVRYVDESGLPAKHTSRGARAMGDILHSVGNCDADQIKAPLSEEVIQGESKADTFKRLATARVNKALKYIDLVKNLSNRSVYEYTSEQVETILKTVRAQVDSLERAFIQSEKKAPTISL